MRLNCVVSKLGTSADKLWQHSMFFVISKGPFFRFLGYLCTKWRKITIWHILSDSIVHFTCRSFTDWHLCLRSCLSEKYQYSKLFPPKWISSNLSLCSVSGRRNERINNRSGAGICGNADAEQPRGIWERKKFIRRWASESQSTSGWRYGHGCATRRGAQRGRQRPVPGPGFGAPSAPGPRGKTATSLQPRRNIDCLPGHLKASSILCSPLPLRRLPCPFLSVPPFRRSRDVGSAFAPDPDFRPVNSPRAHN